MNLEYVFAAYSFIALALFLYMLSFSRRQRRLEEEIRSLRQTLEGSKRD